MITIKKESKKLFSQFGFYENCKFCNKPTATWRIATNTPVCKEWANVHTIEELKSDSKKD